MKLFDTIFDMWLISNRSGCSELDWRENGTNFKFRFRSKKKVARLSLRASGVHYRTGIVPAVASVAAGL